MQVSIFEVLKHIPKPIRADFYKMAAGTLFVHEDYGQHILIRLPSGNYRFGEKGFSKWRNAADLDYLFSTYVERLIQGKSGLSIYEIQLEDVTNTGKVFFMGSSIDEWSGGGEGENIVLEQFLQTECMQTLMECIRRNVCYNN